MRDEFPDGYCGGSVGLGFFKDVSLKLEKNKNNSFKEFKNDIKNKFHGCFFKTYKTNSKSFSDTYFSSIILKENNLIFINYSCNENKKQLFKCSITDNMFIHQNNIYINNSETVSFSFVLPHEMFLVDEIIYFINKSNQNNF
tara:strand:- start:7333 stop:7758 length:426 start_codon:yes stop_codon:yes gene_type:complete